jgi:shikimate 5-dehydrogenase
MMGAGATGIETRSVPTMEFIGVTTGSSSIMQVFPRWARVLELGEARLEGRDLPLGADPGLYRSAVEQIRRDPLSVGALVTTHKINLLAAARDLFDELDPYARLCEEVSCISKREGRLIGHAKDPVTAGRSLETVLDPDHFGRTGGEVLCMGAGGSGTAISVYLMDRRDPADRPARIVMVDRKQESLDALRRVHERLDRSSTSVEYFENANPARNDELMAGLPIGSVVVNATGMGKDIPGSPVTEDGLFPEDGFVWELNYRGELDFLDQARRQERTRNLRIEDGWLYFLHGWSEVVAEVFHIELTRKRFDLLGTEAETIRG